MKHPSVIKHKALTNQAQHILIAAYILNIHESRATVPDDYPYSVPPSPKADDFTVNWIKVDETTIEGNLSHSIVLPNNTIRVLRSRCIYDVATGEFMEYDR